MFTNTSLSNTSPEPSAYTTFHLPATIATATLTAATTITTTHDCSFFNFVMWGCIVMLMCQLGYIGNTLSFLALQRDKANAAIRLLQSLSISDIILLLSVNTTDSIPYFCHFTHACPDPWTTWPYVRYVWLLTPVAHMVCIWLVVLVAANRYWAVCKPHRAVQVWSLSRTNLYIACVVVVSIIFNSPRVFEYKIVDSVKQPNSPKEIGYQNFSNLTKQHIPHLKQLLPAAVSKENITATLQDYLVTLLNAIHDSKTNETSFQKNQEKNVDHKIEIQTDFGRHQAYRVGYKVVVVNFLLVLLPLSLLLVSSVWIIRALRLSEKRVRCPEKSSSGGGALARSGSRGKAKRLSASREVTITLVAVVLVSVVCQTPLAVFHYVRYLHKYNCGSVVYYLESASKLLVNVNSCANFFVYYVISPRFRCLLASLIACKPSRDVMSLKNRSLMKKNCEEISCSLGSKSRHNDGGNDDDGAGRDGDGGHDGGGHDDGGRYDGGGDNDVGFGGMGVVDDDAIKSGGYEDADERKEKIIINTNNDNIDQIVCDDRNKK